MKSSNASASAFGWDFQSNAAIMLMIKNIEEAVKVKVEGQSEDIEITLNNGKMLMSQVKSVLLPNDFSHVKEKLGASLKTLNNAAKNSNVEQLIFITNSPNPFNDTTTMFKFSSPLNIVPFSELPYGCMQVINEICLLKKYDFDTSLLTVCVMQFHGESSEERYKVLTTLITEFLNRLGVRKISTNDLMTLWQHSFTINTSQVTTLITKKRMIWPIIALLCEVSEDDAYFEDYDDNDVTETIQNYRDVINNNSERFEFVSCILNDYNEFHPEMLSRERTKMFIKGKWQNYENSFDLRNTHSNIAEMVIRLTIANVLRGRKVISDIKGKVKL